MPCITPCGSWFFFTPHSPLDGSPVHLNAQFLRDKILELATAQCWVFCKTPVDKSVHRFGDFGCMLRAALAGHQAHEPLVLEGRVDAVVGVARKSKGVGSSRDGPAVFTNPTDHLVFDLDEVSWIEKLKSLELLIGDLSSLGIEGVVMPKYLELTVGRTRLFHDSLP